MPDGQLPDGQVPMPDGQGSDARPPDAAGDDDDDEDGCGCRTRGPDGAAGLVFLIGAVAFGLRRRRR
jgi:MYXO-CTERM domain-containing protein